MIWWAALLFFSGIALIFAEFIVPGGVCGVVGGILVGMSCLLGCIAFPQHMLFIILGEFLAALLCVFIGFYFLPRTWVGKVMILRSGQPLDEGWVSTVSDQSLVGQQGEVFTALRPAGTILVDGHRVDAVSNGDFIDKGTAIRVTEVHGNRVVVERAEE